MSTACQMLGIGLDKCDVGPSPRELPVCRHGAERLTVQKEEPCRELYLLRPKGRSSRSGKAPQRSCLTFSLMGGRESDKCWGEGHSRQRHVSVKVMLRFVNHKEPRTARALELWDLGRSGRVEAGQVGREVKVGMFLRFTYQTHIARKSMYLREKFSLLNERWGDSCTHSCPLHSFALGLKRNNKTLAFTINYFKSVILPGQTLAEFV